MTINVPLTPHLEQFVRDQLASGRFHSEGDIIRAALRLLEGQSLSLGSMDASRRQDPDKGPSSRPSEPVRKTSWDEMRERLRAGQLPGNDPAAIPPVRRSPRGILADLRSYISPDDIKEARREMWAGFPFGEG